MKKLFSTLGVISLTSVSILPVVSCTIKESNTVVYKINLDSIKKIQTLNLNIKSNENNDLVISKYKNAVDDFLFNNFDIKGIYFDELNLSEYVDVQVKHFNASDFVPVELSDYVIPGDWIKITGKYNDLAKPNENTTTNFKIIHPSSKPKPIKNKIGELKGSATFKVVTSINTLFIKNNFGMDMGNFITYNINGLQYSNIQDWYNMFLTKIVDYFKTYDINLGINDLWNDISFDQSSGKPMVISDTYIIHLENEAPISVTPVSYVYMHANPGANMITIPFKMGMNLALHKDLLKPFKIILTKDTSDLSSIKNEIINKVKPLIKIKNGNGEKDVDIYDGNVYFGYTENGKFIKYNILDKPNLEDETKKFGVKIVISDLYNLFFDNNINDGIYFDVFYKGGE